MNCSDKTLIARMAEIRHWDILGAVILVNHQTCPCQPRGRRASSWTIDHSDLRWCAICAIVRTCRSSQPPIEAQSVRVARRQRFALFPPHCYEMRTCCVVVPLRLNLVCEHFISACVASLSNGSDISTSRAVPVVRTADRRCRQQSYIITGAERAHSSHITFRTLRAPGGDATLSTHILDINSSHKFVLMRFCTHCLELLCEEAYSQKSNLQVRFVERSMNFCIYRNDSLRD